MSDDIERRIENVIPQPGYRLVVTWMSGEVTPVDFAGDIKRGGIWAALEDERLFSRVRIAERGTILEWPEPADKEGNPRIDIDGDGLYSLAMQQRVMPLVVKVLDEIREPSREGV